MIIIFCIKIRSLFSGDLGKAKPSETRRHWRLAPGLCLKLKKHLSLCVFRELSRHDVCYQGILCAALKA